MKIQNIKTSDLVENPWNDIELGWLSGILDGEGSIGMSRTIHNSKPIFSVQVQITSCDKPLIDKVVEILEKMGVSKKPTIVNRTRKFYIGNEYCINFQRLTDVKDILLKVKDTLVIKREKAILAIEYVNMRLKECHKSHRFRGRFTGSYTGEEIKYYEKFKILNQKRKRWKSEN